MAGPGGTTAGEEASEDDDGEVDATPVRDMLGTPFELALEAIAIPVPLEGTLSSGFSTALTRSVVDLEIDCTIPVTTSVGFGRDDGKLVSSVARGLLAPACLPVVCESKDGRELSATMDRVGRVGGLMKEVAGPGEFSKSRRMPSNGGDRPSFKLGEKKSSNRGLMALTESRSAS
jgi:hypothetical protein